MPPKSDPSAPAPQTPATPSQASAGPTQVPVDLTITSQLAKIEEGFPATELIKVLLRYVAVDAKNFVRDTHAASQVFSRSHQVYNGIQGLMKKVENSTAGTIEWVAFDQYTIAIPPLEKLLLAFYANYTEDKKRDHLPSVDGIETALLSISIWEYDREMLENAWKELAGDALNLSKDEKVQLLASYQQPRANDDHNTIRALNHYFTQVNKLTDRDIVQSRTQKFVGTVRRDLRAIAGKLTNKPPVEVTTFIAIKTMMIAYIPFALISSAKSTEAVKDHLKSTLIWQPLEALVQHVLDLVDKGDVSKIAELEKEWNALRDLLLKVVATDIDTVEEIVDLLKLAAGIRRPLHGRCVQLIRMLYYLDIYSKDNKNNATRHRQNIKLVMGDSIGALEVAKKAVTDVKTITLNNAQYHEQASSLSDILRKVEELFTAVNLSNEWPKRQEEYTEAVKIDESHLTAMRQRLNISG